MVQSFENFRHLAIDDLAGKAFGNCRLADARVAYEQRIVLGTSAENLDGSIDFVFASDEWVNLSFRGLLVEIDAVGLKRIRLALLLGGASVAHHRLRCRVRGCSPCSTPRTGRVSLMAGPLGNAVRDIVHRVVARHVLLLQEVGGVALTLGEDRDKHIGARHLFATG